MSTREEMLDLLAKTIKDYRQGEIPQRTPKLIEEWLQQFPKGIHEDLMDGLIHVLDKTYISGEVFKSFLQMLASNDKLSHGSDPADYWRSANFLNIQQGGNSQRDILQQFDKILQKTHGFSLKDTGSERGDYIYLDDCVGTGSRVRRDICTWLEAEAPKQVNLHIITPILFKGSWWIDARIKATATANGKNVSIHKWRMESLEMENRKNYKDTSDVLWPTAIPDEPSVQEYAQYLDDLGYPALLRKPGSVGTSNIFRDDAQRIALENAFLVRGCQIREECGNLPDPARPLGFHNLDCLGFGSMFVIYRNCPNNCPLAFWVDQEEYPTLFPRKTNTEAATERELKGLPRT